MSMRRGSAHIGAPDELVVLYLVPIAIGDNTSVLQDSDSICNRRYDPHVMLGDDQRNISRERLEDLDHIRGLGGRHSCRWLVDKKEFRPASESEGQLDLTLVAIG